MIRAKGLDACIGGFTLRGIDLSVEPGESFFILGPSGAGKTLLLEALLGVCTLAAGQVLLEGVDVTRLPPELRRVAYVPQDLALFPHLGVRDNILFGLRAKGRLPEDASARLARWVELLDLGSVLDRREIAACDGAGKLVDGLIAEVVVHPGLTELASVDEPAGFVVTDGIRSSARCRRGRGTRGSGCVP